MRTFSSSAGERHYWIIFFLLRCTYRDEILIMSLNVAGKTNLNLGHFLERGRCEPVQHSYSWSWSRTVFSVPGVHENLIFCFPRKLQAYGQTRISPRFWFVVVNFFFYLITHFHACSTFTNVDFPFGTRLSVCLSLRYLFDPALLTTAALSTLCLLSRSLQRYIYWIQ